jgi:putative YphP/YqiW family bacilliredoxin
MYQINSKPPIYDTIAIQPMRDELLSVGFEEMLTPEVVKRNLFLEDDETKLVFINSVCGCSAGSARPGVALALQNKKIPHKLYTSFAGNDRDSVDLIRKKYLSRYAPSSPAIAIIKNGKTLFHMGRADIIEKTPEKIAKQLTDVFDTIDGREGPSINSDNYRQLINALSCGSKIPRYSN